MNINTHCPHCNGELTIDEQWRGREMECPYCRKTFTFAAKPSSAQSISLLMPSQQEPPQQKKSIKEYKVLTQKDKWFSGKFDPEKL